MRSNVTLPQLIGVTLVLWQSASVSWAQFPDENEATLQKRAQIDAYIARVREEETFEELAAGLNEREAAVEEILPVGFSIGADSQVWPSKFEGCLVNRRMARLFEILRDREDADALCRSLFDEKLSLLKESFQTNLKALAEQGGPRREPVPLGFPVQFPPAPLKSEAAAVSAAVFLSAEFCPVDEVLRQLDAWIAQADECNEQLEEASSEWTETFLVEFTKDHITQTISPEPRFQLSLLASMYERRFADDPGGTWADDSEAVAAFAESRNAVAFKLNGRLPDWAFYRRVILCAWDAPTTLEWPDTHVYWPDNFGEFRVFRCGIENMPEDIVTTVLNQLRKRLLAAAAEKSAKQD